MFGAPARYENEPQQPPFRDGTTGDYSGRAPEDRDPARRGSAEPLADALGWFSLALGAAELLAPRAVCRALGMDGQEKLVRAYGLRECASGIGILTSDDKTAWVWSRVAGDVLDLATLGAALEDSPKRGNLGFALCAVAGVTLLDVMCGRQLAAPRRPALPAYDYSDRSGLPRTPAAMRGAALEDFETPREYRGPEAARPQGAM